MQFFSSTVSGRTSHGRTYTTFDVARAPDPNFSVAPFLALAFEEEEIVDIEDSGEIGSGGDEEAGTDKLTGENTSREGASWSDAVSPTKRTAQEAGLDEEPAPTKRPATPGTDAPSSSSPTASGLTKPSPAPSKTASARTDRNRSRFRDHRKKTQDAAFDASGQQPKPKDAKKHVFANSATALPKPVCFSTLPVASTGYEGAAKGSSGPATTRTIKEVMAMGKYQKICWDGIEPFFLTDPATGAILVAGAGRINDDDYTKSHQNAAAKILKAGLMGGFTLDHKRGKDFGACNIGILYGHGPKVPYNLRNGKHDAMLEDLLADKDIQRLATFQSSSFATFFPRLYKKYHALRNDVKLHMRDLKWNFRRSVFSAAAFNFGPQTITSRHRDSMNLPSGFCAITALGDFAYEEGGHLVIEEIGVVIEFPPGSCILIPSAVFTHSNTSIQPGETRVSFTQFSSGALFRFADNGWRTEEQLKAYDEELYDAAMDRKATRWEKAVALWGTFEGVLKAAGLRETCREEKAHDERLIRHPSPSPHGPPGQLPSPRSSIMRVPPPLTHPPTTIPLLKASGSQTIYRNRRTLPKPPQLRPVGEAKLLV